VLISAMSTQEQQLRDQIKRLTADYYAVKWPKRPFRPGMDYVPVSGKVFDQLELVNLMDSSLDFWLTAGRYGNTFESRFAKWMNTR